MISTGPSGLGAAAVSRVVGRLLVVLRHEVERQAVHAEALPGRCGPVIEDVAQVRAASGAADLGPDHPVTAVDDELDRLCHRWLGEARPATARLELRRRVEQLLAARRA